MFVLKVLPLLEAEARKRMLAGKRSDPSTLISQGKAAAYAAKLMGVSPRYVEQAKRVS